MTVTILSGSERRRRWTTAEKLRIVQESQAPDAMVSEIARRHDVHPNQLHLWRRQASQPSSSAGAARNRKGLSPSSRLPINSQINGPTISRTPAIRQVAFTGRVPWPEP